MRGLLVIAGIQWFSGLVLSVLAYFAFGWISFWPIPFGLFLGALLFFLKVALPPLTREGVRHISKWSGALAIGIVTVSYWVLFVLFPQSFNFTWQEALWLGPCLGFGGGLVTLICTLIAGDTAATIRSEVLN